MNESSSFDISTVVSPERVDARLDKRAMEVSSMDSPDTQRWAYSRLMQRQFGVKDFDGSMINNMQPLEPDEALKRVREAIEKKTFDPLLSDNYKAWQGLETDEERLAFAKNLEGTWSSSVIPGVENTIKRTMGEYILSLDDLQYLTDDDIAPEHRAAFEKFHKEQVPLLQTIDAAHKKNAFTPMQLADIRRTNPEYAAAENAQMLARKFSPQYLQKVSDRRLVANAQRHILDENMWLRVAAVKRLGDDLKPVLSYAGRTVLEYAERHKGDLGEYSDVFLNLDPDERSMLAPIIHGLHPNKDTWLLADAGRAFWDNAVGLAVDMSESLSGMVVRSIVGGEEYQAQRRAEADLRIANRARMKDWGFFGDAIIGASGTLPYMGMMATGWGGFAGAALASAQRFEDQVVEQGGDVSSMDFFLTKFAVAAAHTAVEKMQFAHLAGKLPQGALRQAHLDMFHSIHAALKVGKVAAGNWASETLEEGLQGGIEQGFIAWGLGEDVASAAASGVLNDMKESAGTMMVLTAGGTAIGRARYRRGAFDNNADALVALSRLQDLRTKLAGNANGRDMKDFSSEYGYFARAWLNKGQKGLTDMGLSPIYAAAMSDHLYNIWRSVQGNETARKRFADGGKVLTVAEALSKAMPWFDVTTNEDGTLQLKTKADPPAGTPQMDVTVEFVPDASIKFDYNNARTVSDIVAAINRGRGPKDQMSVESFKALSTEGKDKIVAAYKLRPEGYFTARAKTGAEVTEDQLNQMAGESEGALPFGAAIRTQKTGETHTQGYDLPVDVQIDRKVGDVWEMPDGTLQRITGFDADGNPVMETVEAEVAAVEALRGREGEIIQDADGRKQQISEVRPDGTVVLVSEMGEYTTVSANDLLAPVQEEAVNAEPVNVPDAAIEQDAQPETVQDEAVKAEPQRNITGRIVLEETAAPGSIFHEVFHAVARFLIDSGALDAQAVEVMRAMFGDPLYKDEVFNEDVAAEAYRGYLQGMVDVVEGSPLEKFLAGVKESLKFLRFLRNKRRNDLADWEQVFENLKSGNISGITAVANETAKRMAQQRSMDEARQKAAGAAARGHKAEEAETNEAKAEAAGTETAETAATDGAPAPTPAGDDVEQAKAEAAARFGGGNTATQGQDVGKQTATDSALEPGEWEAETPDGAVKVRGYWAVMPSDDLITSDSERYDQHVQPRNRLVMAAIMQIFEIAKNLNPLRLFGSTTTDNGAPIVLPNGMVVTGNGRVMALREAVKLGTISRYHATMREQAAKLGLNVPADMKNPVLVRVLTSQMDDATLQDFARRSNMPTVLSMNAAENAEADARAMLDSKIIELLETDENGNLHVASNRAFMEAFIMLTGDQGLRLSDGSISNEAYKRARRAILAAILVEAPNARDLITEIVEADPEEGVGFARAVDGATRAGAKLVQLITDNPDYSIAADMAQAIGEFVDFNRMKRAGVAIDIESYLAQRDFFSPRSGIAEALIREFSMRPSAKSVADMLLHYAKNAALQDNSSPTLFEMTPVTREELLDIAIRATLSDEEAASRPKTREGIVNAAEPAPKPPEVAPEAAAPARAAQKAKPEPAKVDSPEQEPLLRISPARRDALAIVRARAMLEPDNLRQYLESKDVRGSAEAIGAVRETIQQMLPFFADSPPAPAVGATVGAEDSPALAAPGEIRYGGRGERKIRAARIMRAIAESNPVEKISPEELNAAFEAGEDVSVILPEFYTPPYNKAWPISGFRIRGAGDIAALSMQLRSPYQEMFKAVYLDKDNVVIDGRVLTVGLINASLVSPHLVFSNMPEGTTSIVIGHNHPTGDPNPSPEDIQISKFMLEAGRSLGVKVVDHVITDGTMYYSMRNENLVDFDAPQKPGRRGKRVADWAPQTADWEAFPMVYAPVVNKPEVAQIVSENLRYVDSENVFVYVMNNKLKLLGVSRIKADQFEARDKLGQRNSANDHALIAKRVARFGASNSFFVDLPAGFFKHGVEHAGWFSSLKKTQSEAGLSRVNDVLWKNDGGFWSAEQGEPLPGRHPTAFGVAETGNGVRYSLSENVWNTPQQKISSANTSINSSQLPASFRKISWVSGTRNADIGGGRFDNATEYLDGLGVENVIYDPYNRSQEHNDAAVAKISNGNSDTATVNNVLNVIAEESARESVIKQAANAISEDGVAYFLIYQGNGSGVGTPTKAGWQENRKADSYTDEIAKHFGKVTRQGNMLVASQPKKGGSDIRFRKADEGMADTLEQDAAYMAAVEAGDKASAQKMVDEAALAAGLEKIEPTDFRDPAYLEPMNEVFEGRESQVEEMARQFAENGYSGRPVLVIGENAITGSHRIFAARRANEIILEDDLDSDMIKIPVYELTEDQASAFDEWIQESGDSIATSYSDYHRTTGDDYDRSKDARKAFEAGVVPLEFEALLRAEKLSNDGNGFEEFKGDIYASPSQIKSADAVTYDDEGNIIPPSERFNERTPDIRYSIVGDRGGDIDAAMKAGFTERVFHGTGAKSITKFRLGSKSHGVKAAYLSYDRGAASSYAALAKLDGQDNAHVEEYLVNPGRMLAVDAADTPDFGGFGDFLKKAKSGVHLSNRFDLGVDDVRYSIYSPYQSGQFGAGTVLSAIIATDKVKGIDRPDDEYRQLAAALHTKPDIAKAKRDADDFLRKQKNAANMDVADIAQEMTKEKFPELVEKLFAKGADYGVEVGIRAQKGMIKAEKNAIADARGASLYDLVADTGIDISRILLSVLPEDFDPKRAAKRDAAKDEEESNAEGGSPEFVGPLTEEQLLERTRLDEARKKKVGILMAKLQAWRLQQDELKARKERDAAIRAEEAANGADADVEKSDEELDAEDELEEMSLIVPQELIADSGVDLNDALEFAHLLRLFVESWLAGPGVDPGTTLGDRINVAKFRKTMIAQLSEIADKWLDPNDSRTAVQIDRQIMNIPDSANPDTIEHRTASIIATIQRAAIRQTRNKLIKDIRDSIAQIAIEGKRLDEMEQDVKRKIKGDHEATARYVSDILSWGVRRIEREMQRLDDIINDRAAQYEIAKEEYGKTVSISTDVQVRRAMEKRAALERWGGLKNKLPADILRGKAEIESWLETERIQHEQKWEAQKAEWDELAEIIQVAVQRDPKNPKPGRRNFGAAVNDEFSATVRQKLELLMQGGGPKAQQAIERIVDMLNQGSEDIAIYRAKYRKQLDEAFDWAVQGQDMSVRDLLSLLDEQIPAELNERVASEEQGNFDMSWKQAADLYAYLCQTASYGKNITIHGRDGQRELLRDALPVPVLRLVSRLQDIYQQRRDELSAKVEEVIGFPVSNPDPMYMPMRMYVGAREGLDSSVHSWTPLAKSLTPRRIHGLDVNEHTDIISMYQRSTEDSILAMAFGARGIALRSILTRQATVDAISRYHGDARLRKLIEQVTDTLTDGWKSADDSWQVRGIQRASTLTTYAALSHNLAPSLKQMMSIPAWVAVLDGGYMDIIKFIARFDLKSSRELVAARGFEGRYGTTGFGQMVKDAFADKTAHPIVKLYKAGMTPLQFGDFVASILVGTGVYKAKRADLIRKGMSYEQASEQAARVTWGLVEETQQSGRQQNTPHFIRRSGVFARQMYKFASAPLLQLSHESHAFSMWRNAATPEEKARTRKRLVNILIANHIIMPICMRAVETAFAALLGDEPDKEELLGALLVDMLVGPLSRVVLAGAVANRGAAGLVRMTGLKPKVWDQSSAPAFQFAERLAKSAALLPSDIANADWEGVRDTLVEVVSLVFVPARMAKKAVHNATDYNPSRERAKRERARRTD